MPQSDLRPDASWRVFSQKLPIILASASPRRRELLGLLGLDFRVLPAACPEDAPLDGENPEAYARRAALDKALNVLGLLGSAIRRKGPGGSRSGDSGACRPPLIIGADTIVLLDGVVYGKPRDAAQALEYLNKLSGRGHEVITACALLVPDGAGEYSQKVMAVKSFVRMWRCPLELLRAYAETGEPLDKAGAYAVQGAGAFLIREIRGSWSNVVGLPVSELAECLLRLEIITPFRGESCK